jgi:hypothetical protein
MSLQEGRVHWVNDCRLNGYISLSQMQNCLHWVICRLLRLVQVIEMA